LETERDAPPRDRRVGHKPRRGKASKRGARHENAVTKKALVQREEKKSTR